MMEQTRDEAQPSSAESQLDVQQQERQILDSRCLYIPTEILAGLAANNADSKDQSAVGYSQMAIVPASFEVWIATPTRF